MFLHDEINHILTLKLEMTSHISPLFHDKSNAFLGFPGMIPMERVTFGQYNSKKSP